MPTSAQDLHGALESLAVSAAEFFALLGNAVAGGVAAFLCVCHRFTSVSSLIRFRWRKAAQWLGCEIRRMRSGAENRILLPGELRLRME
jgi:hypothetical protein